MPRVAAVAWPAATKVAEVPRVVAVPAAAAAATAAMPGCRTRLTPRQMPPQVVRAAVLVAVALWGQAAVPAREAGRVLLLAAVLSPVVRQT